MHYLGLDIGGTKIAAVVMDAHGWEIRRYRCRRKVDISTICLMRCGAYRAD